MNVPTHIILPNKSSPVPLRHAKSIDVNADSDVFSVKDQATSPFLRRSPPPHPLSHQLPSKKPLQKTDVKEQAAADVNMISNKSSSSSYTFTFKPVEASSDVSLAVKKPRFRGCRGGRKQRLRKQRKAIRRNNNHAAMASSSSSSSHESSSSTFSNASSDKTKTTVRPSQSMKSAAVATSGDASSRKNESSIASSLSHKLISSTTTRSDVSSDTKGALLNAKKKKATIRLRPSQRKKKAVTNTSASTSTITTNNNNNKKKKPIVKLSNEEALCLFAAVVVKEKNVDSISPLAPRCCLHILDEDAAKNAESLNEFMCRVSFADGSTKDVEVKSSELVGFVSFLLECDKTWVFHIKLQSSDAWSIVSPNDILQHVQFLVHYAVRDLRDTHKMRKPWQREWIFLDNDLMYY